MCECDREGFCSLRVCVCVEVGATQCALQRQTELAQMKTGQHVHTTTELKRQTTLTELQSMWIDAKQLTVAAHGVFKSCLAGRQTDRERDETVFNTV